MHEEAELSGSIGSDPLRELLEVDEFYRWSYRIMTLQTYDLESGVLLRKKNRWKFVSMIQLLIMVFLLFVLMVIMFGSSIL
ncbi:MAG: hypothetical protein U9R75_09825 [Candidatus Thermoplasmatota archaeon]|nr:hypothetical protein [Candidatus Thermoplasmatota archaeon]